MASNIETDRTKCIPKADRNDEWFLEPQTVFLEPGYSTDLRDEKNRFMDYDFSSRLSSNYAERHTKAWKAAQEKGYAIDSAEMLEAYLQKFFRDETLKLVAIVAGFEPSDGSTCLMYMYFRDRPFLNQSTN